MIRKLGWVVRYHTLTVVVCDSEARLRSMAWRIQMLLSPRCSERAERRMRDWYADSVITSISDLTRFRRSLRNHHPPPGPSQRCESRRRGGQCRDRRPSRARAVLRIPAVGAGHEVIRSPTTELCPLERRSAVERHRLRFHLPIYGAPAHHPTLTSAAGRPADDAARHLSTHFPSFYLSLDCLELRLGFFPVLSPVLSLAPVKRIDALQLSSRRVGPAPLPPTAHMPATLTPPHYASAAPARCSAPCAVADAREPPRDAIDAPCTQFLRHGDPITQPSLRGVESS
eukprot:COSAG01_NODE_6614_length_3581_cov_1.071018_2_plen_285_part_00